MLVASTGRYLSVLTQTRTNADILLSVEQSYICCMPGPCNPIPPVTLCFLLQMPADEDLLSKSCFSQIRLDRGGDEFEDDELTSLEWLQDGNLLKNINSG